MNDVGESGHGYPNGGGSAAATLENVVDPVVGVDDGTVTYANEAARDAFDLAGERPWETEPIEGWERLEPAVDETTVGTARRVDLGDEWSARVHRGPDGATITFEARAHESPSVDDRAVKERAINEAPVGIAITDPDREDNPLVYVNDAFRRVTGYEYDDVVGRNCRFLQGEESNEDAIAEMRAAVDEERPVTVEVTNYRKDGTPFWNEVTIAPVRNERGEVTNYVGFQNDVTARKEAELALERRTDELEYILERVEGLVQDVTTAVTGSTSRGELEDAVCERVVEEPTYEAVWIGERNPATGQVAVRTAAGSAVATDSAPISADGHPATEALANGSVVVEPVDGRTNAAFPLSFNGVEYGVMTVELDDDRSVDDREEVILSSLARAVASGINARETSKVLETDAVVAVEIELSDRTVAPVALSFEADCRLEYRRSVHRTGDETASLYSVVGTDAESLEAAADRLDGVDCRVVVEREESCLIELLGDEDPVSWFADRGVRVRTVESDRGTARITLEIPRSANVRSIVEALENRYDRTDVISFRQHDRNERTQQEFAARLEAELTDRQFAVLQRAYLGGYFKWPRPATGEELAQSLDVSRPTFHEHLRAAEAKLCRAFFDDE
ncbi:bacterio-opsin activator domain-containing protein [Natrarchaeobius oligotrophus]|uniref:PAS domain-containing protein n=1 Tax=Natrarchaeobius chitinivorans TaxID=1679083 RepID=A0A3N6M4U1_NATCH|nr:bacterio-opsin activator domain-containing protein [Natrarchaeobius chitinivorans]RQG98558.1 PAS domain-containing protein [Natrarchaeobius chitinivorans]